MQCQLKVMKELDGGPIPGRCAATHGADWEIEYLDILEFNTSIHIQLCMCKHILYFSDYTLMAIFKKCFQFTCKRTHTAPSCYLVTLNIASCDCFFSV